MRFYTSNINAHNLSDFSDEDLLSFRVSDRKALKIPIELRKTLITQNANEQLVISFDCPIDNLDFRYGEWFSEERENNDYDVCPWPVRGIEISTKEKFWDPELAEMVPITSLLFCLEAENEDEDSNLLQGAIAVTFTEGTYDIAIVSWCHLLTPKEYKKNSIKIMKNDRIYGIKFEI